MTVTVSVVIATFGDLAVWAPEAEAAVGSAHSQTVAPAEVIHSHRDTLHEARNLGARTASADWVVFCDADDRLAPGYIEAMTAAIEAAGPTRPLLVQPATRGWNADGHLDDTANLIPPRASGPAPLLHGNHLVIGTAVRRDQLLRVGGFRDLPFWEDWDLWVRCWCDGADIITAEAAEYLVQVRDDSRNQPRTGSEVQQLLARIRPEHRRLARAAGRIR